MRLIVGKSLIFILCTVCLEAFGFKFKQLKKFKAGAFIKNNNNIKALKGPITLLKSNYTRKIVDLVKNSKIC